MAITTSSSESPSYSSSSVSKEQEHGFLDININDTYYIWVKPNTGFNKVSMSGDFSDNTNKSSGQYYQVSFKGSTSTTSKTVTVTFKTTYYFSATATPNISAFGSATAKVDASIESTNSSESKTATFAATPNSGYVFAGWGATADATTYESTANPYYPKITNTTSGSTAQKKLYAIFKPVFYFRVAAQKIYDHGTVSASVANSVIGEPTETSASAQATFTAAPDDDCTFQGWYYDAEHTQKASDDATYTPDITNEEVGSTKSLILYAWFKKNQTLAFTSSSYEKNVVQGMTVAGAATATATSGLTVAYSSGNDAVLSVNESGDVTGVTASNDDVTVTVTQEGNDEYNSCSIERVFHVIEKKETSFTTTLSGDNSTICVDDQHTITVKDEGEGFVYESSDPDVVAIAKSDDIITLTALKVGKSTITLTQPETETHAAVTRLYVITVEKVANTLGVTPEAFSAFVGGTVNVTISGQNNTGTPVVATIADQTLSSSVSNGGEVIAYADGVITALNAGTAKITFTQAATGKYEGYTSATYDITVSKTSNPITVTLNGGSATSIKLKYGAAATLSYSSVNTETECSVTRTSGSYTSMSGNVITAGNTAGTDVYEIVQSETYKYEAGYAQFSVRVNNTDEAEMYIVNEETEYSEWKLKTLHTYSLDGHPGDMLYFEAKKYSTGSNSGFYADYSTDNGSTWKEKWFSISVGNDWQSYTTPLPDGVTHIRFELYEGSTMNKYIRNVKVSRKTYVRATADKTSLGTVYTDATAQANLSVSYSTTNGGNIQVSSSNSRFAVSKEEITTANNSDGTVNLSVTYTPDPNQLGTDEATLTIQDLFYTAQVKLTATAAKHANTLEVVEAQDVKVDDIINNVYTDKNSDAEIVSAVTPEGVITYDAGTNSIKAVGAGEATLTLTQNATDTYLGTTKSVKVTVSRYDQTITWDNDLSADNLILRKDDVFEGNTATASSGLAVTYSSGNASAIEVDATTGKLTAKAVGSNIAVTATQEGNYKYNSASETRYFTVVNSELVLYPGSTSAIKYSEYSKVTLMRTLKAGYNSIALPFNTTVEELAGEGDRNWVAQLSTVTYNAKDGYSLFFKKVEDGTMEANQPYILYLAEEVENPVFTDKSGVVAATPAEHYASNGINASGWKMVSNYTPKTDMTGKYGVVNADGCLKKGGAGSYINAYTAYIEFSGGESSNVRAVFVDDDTDAIADIQQEGGQTMIYDLQGRRLFKAGTGIVIIRNADGSVRKEKR